MIALPSVAPVAADRFIVASVVDGGIELRPVSFSESPSRRRALR